MLELRHLRSLVALAETGTVSRAAERVHLTQSALSHQLKALESHYGAAVVRRHGQSVRLTESGQRLVALARSVMGEVQRPGVLLLKSRRHTDLRLTPALAKRGQLDTQRAGELCILKNSLY